MQYVVAGLVLGGIYAISAVALALTYTTSRVFNFAQGSISFFVAIAFYRLDTVEGWSAWAAGVATVCVLAPLLGVVLWAVLFRSLTDASPTVKLVATIGLAVALPPLGEYLFFRDQVFETPGLFGPAPGVHHVLGATLNDNEVAVIVAALAVAVVMTVVLRATTSGLLVRAVVDAELMSELTGTSSKLVGMAVWAIGTTLAGLAGVLVAPIITLKPSANFLLLLIASFAAVVAGRLTNLARAFAGAVVLGILTSFVVRYQQDLPDWLPKNGIRPSVPFLFMAVFLIVYPGLGRERGGPSRRAVDDEEAVAETIEARTAGRRARAVRALVVGALVVGGPWLLAQQASPVWTSTLAAGCGVALVLLSFVVVTGEGGMISLCQITFAGIGAITTGQLATEHGWPLLPAVLAAGLVAVPFGLLLALLALRLGDLYLALATLAFALLMENVVFQADRFANFGNGVAVPRPEILGFAFDTDLRMTYLLLAVFGLLALLVANLRASTTGLKLAAMRSSEVATSTLGISVRNAKLLTFGVSAAIAGIGGALMSVNSQIASPADFNALLGLVWLAVVVLWGVRSTLGALLAGAFVAMLPVFVAQHFSADAQTLVPVLFGLGAIGLAREPRGLLAANAASLRRWRRRLAHRDPLLETVEVEPA